MYKCLNCGAVFDYPDYEDDFTSEYFGRPVTHHISVCPECRSDELDTAERCQLCGEYHSGESDYCADCVDLIIDYFDSVIAEVSERFGYGKDKIVEAIKEIY
jgi:hypothetical protein